MANINETVIDINDLRINKLRSYLLGIIDTLLTDKKYQINANMLSADINNYSIDKIPTETVVEKWITGNTIQRDLYSFRSRNSYSQDTLLLSFPHPTSIRQSIITMIQTFLLIIYLSV